MNETRYNELAAKYPAIRNNLRIARRLDLLWTQYRDQFAGEFGDGDGRLISGIYRDHYPEWAKWILRKLAHSSTRILGECLTNAKPKYARDSTIMAMRNWLRHSYQPTAIDLSLTRIKVLFDIINTELCTINAIGDWQVMESLLTEFFDCVHNFLLSDDGYELWSIGEFGEFSLDSFLVGFYWFASHYYAGQTCPIYALLCQCGQIYSPGMSSGPEPDSSEQSAYNALQEYYTENS